jgi:uncharacterized protein (TIGR03435 family)
MRAIAAASLIVLTVASAFGQPSGGRPAFEVAVIKRYPEGAQAPQGGGNGVRVSPDGVTSRYTKLWAWLEWAYDVPGRVLGPDWIFSERYDITAKASGPVPESRLKLMAQALVEDRFQLRFHRITSELPLAVLVLGKNGPRNLQALESGGLPSVQRSDGELIFRNLTMERFAEALSGRPPYGVNEKVVDRTGLKGAYTSTLSVKEFDADDPQFEGKFEELQRAAFDFISKALERRYGLRLEHRKVAIESLVVDSGNKTPADN